jgi:hypothetical protein
MLKNGKNKSLTLTPDTIKQLVTDAHETIWTISSFAETMCMSKDAVRMRIHRGQIPARKVGHSWYILKSEYLKYLKSSTENSL